MQCSLQNKKGFNCLKPFFCDPAEARTLDPQIKSLLLYQLSYGVIIYKQNDTMKSIILSKLPDLDSNQDRQNQNLQHYHYTIGH